MKIQFSGGILAQNRTSDLDNKTFTLATVHREISRWRFRC